MTTIDADRSAVREHLLAAREQIRSGTSEAADAQTRAAEEIIGRWETEDRLVEFLTPLLDDERRSVRFGAASYLLSRGHHEQAVPTLERIRDARKGMEAPTARLLLDDWRETQPRG